MIALLIYVIISSLSFTNANETNELGLKHGAVYSGQPKLNEAILDKTIRRRRTKRENFIPPDKALESLVSEPVSTENVKMGDRIGNGGDPILYLANYVIKVLTNEPNLKVNRKLSLIKSLMPICGQKTPSPLLREELWINCSELRELEYEEQVFWIIAEISQYLSGHGVSIFSQREIHELSRLILDSDDTYLTSPDSYIMDVLYFPDFPEEEEVNKFRSLIRDTTVFLMSKRHNKDQLLINVLKKMNRDLKTILVQCFDKPLYDQYGLVTALNFQKNDNKFILLRCDIFSSLEAYEQVRLVFHEMLPLYGVDDADYSQSAKLSKLFIRALE